MSGDALVAGVELGGTKCVCILASRPGRVAEQVRIETGAAEPTLDAIAEVLARWRGRAAGLGIASFGPLELDPAAPDYGSIVKTTKPGWSGVNLLARLGSGSPSAIDTDVNAAALAEGAWGAARGLRSWAYVTVGTGVGVGTIVDGRPVRGLGHSEAGHMRVPRLLGDSWPGACSFHGDCVEGLASGPAIAARIGQDAATLPDDDPAWETVAHALAMMIGNLMLAAAPERIIIGGGVATGRPALLGRIRSRLVESLAGYAFAERIGDASDYIVTPALGNRAGPLGAVALALEAARSAK